MILKYKHNELTNINNNQIVEISNLNIKLEESKSKIDELVENNKLKYDNHELSKS